MTKHETAMDELRDTLAGLTRLLRAPAGRFTVLGEGKGLAGAEDTGPTRAATFDVGRDFSALRPILDRTARGTWVRSDGKRPIGGLIIPSEREDGEISVRAIVNAVIGKRIAQVGDAALVGATILNAKGVYEGGEENTLRFEIRWSPVSREALRESTYLKFRRNITELCEELCTDFAQAEIHVQFADGGSRDTVFVTPLGFAGGYAGRAQLRRAVDEGDPDHLLLDDREGVTP